MTTEVTSSGAAPGIGRLAGLANDVRVLAERDLKQVFKPGALLGTIGFPLIFLIMFYAVLHRMLHDRGIDFGRYVTPTVVVQALMFIAIASAVSFGVDRSSGLLSRWRCLPISDSAVAFARVLVVAAEAVTATAVITIAGHLVGFRFSAGIVAGTGFVLIAVLFAVTVSAGTAIVGLTMRDPEAMTAVLNLPYLPLLVISTGFVPLKQFPHWLQPVVHWSPVSATVDALRALSAGPPTFDALWPALAWFAGMAVVFGWAATRAFRGLDP